MSRYLLLISNEGNTFYKEVLTYSDRSFLLDFSKAREQGHQGAWRLTERKLTKPDREELRRITGNIVITNKSRGAIRERLKLMGCKSISELKTNQLQSYANFLRKLSK